MTRILKIVFIFIVAYVNIACFCSGVKLTPELITDSELIFEGKLMQVDTVPNVQKGDVLTTFKVKKVFKGETKKEFVIRSSRGSCGFTNYQWRYRNLGRTYLLYLTKKEGQYYYNYCSNRIAYQSLHEDDMNYEEGEKFKETNKRKFIEYTKELKTLDSLLTINK